MLNEFKSIMDQKGLKSKKVLLAVSGGVDSMVMAFLFKAAGIPFSVAHCNFQLREEAKEDEVFVQDWCAKHSIKCYSTQFETAKFAQENKMGIQEAARVLRYTYFDELIVKHKIDFVATAHHQDDNIETVLFNFLRGTSLKGLTGMALVRNQLVRPLLHFSKEQILNYAYKEKIEWREDVSNTNNKYKRNFLRNDLIPQLEKEFPNFKERLLGSIHRFKESEVFYSTSIAKKIKKVIIHLSKDEIKVPIRWLEKQPLQASILYEIFKEYAVQSTQIAALQKLLQSKPGSKLETATHFIYHYDNHLLVQKKGAVPSIFFKIESENGSVQLLNGSLSWSIIDKPHKISPNKLYSLLDADKVTFPLVIRQYKTADYFYPLGMRKKKKLSRYFIDQKFTAKQKKMQVVICSDKKIVALAGERIDDRFKIENQTKRVIQFIFKPND